MAYMRDSLGRRLDSFAVEPRRAQTLVVFGDSLTEQGGMLPGYPESAASARDIRAFSPWTWGNMLLNQAFTVLDNLGVGGQTTTQILARIDDVLAYAPGWVHLIAGTNDMGAGTSTAKANIDSMLDQLDAAGIRVILGTIPPRTGDKYTGTIKADTLELNRWIIEQGRSRAGVVVVDYFTALADVSNNYRASVCGYNSTSDGIHLSATGAYVCGKALAAAVGRYLVQTVPFSAVANRLPYPRPGMIGGGAAVPTGWSAIGPSAGSVVWSDVERADGGGVWKQIVIPSDGIFSMTSNADVSGVLAVGDLVFAVAEFDVSSVQAAPANSHQVALLTKAWNGSSYSQTRAAFNTQGQPIDARSGVLRTPAWPIPAATTVVTVELSFRGGMTVKLDKIGLYKASSFAI